MPNNEEFSLLDMVDLNDPENIPVLVEFFGFEDELVEKRMLSLANIKAGIGKENITLENYEIFETTGFIELPAPTQSNEDWEDVKFYRLIKLL